MDTETDDVIFLKVGDHSGAVTVDGYHGWCEASEVSLDVHPENLSEYPRHGPISIREVIVTKPIDRCSPRFFQVACTGSLVKQVELCYCTQSSGKKPLCYYRILLKKVSINGYTLTDVDRRPHEVLRFYFETIDITYTEFETSGAARGEITTGWKVSSAEPMSGGSGFIHRNRPPRSHVDDEEKTPGSRLFSLFFGTNRKPTFDSDKLVGFGNERDSETHHGTCSVSIPKWHRIGSLGSPWWKRWLTLRDDRLKLTDLKRLDERHFWEELRLRLTTWENEAFIFIHGFNVSFEEAALRTAQMGFDLQLKGVSAFFSWPSKGRVSGYTADEASVEASETQLSEFLLKLALESGAKKINVLAHSMGNRGLLRALSRIRSDLPLGQVFFAAPDVDREVFRDLSVDINSSERRTLYVSSKDLALVSSGIVHDHPRAGFSPPVTVVEGIDTVETASIDITLLGHGYYAEARPLLQDMHQLLRFNPPPEERMGLSKQVHETGKAYWQFLK